MEVFLNWSELKPISEIDHAREEYGVYLWGFSFDGEFIPYYVGIAYNISIAGRLTEHANNLIGGRYCIIHSADLKHFYKFKNVSEPTVDNGLIYIPNWPTGYTNFLRRRHELKNHIGNMADRMHFSFAVLGDKFKSKKEYELVEKACIQSIGKDRLWNTRGGVTTIKIQATGDPKVVGHFKNNAA